MRGTHAERCRRVDPNTPIETSVQALASLVKEGKIGGIGLSEVSASTIRKAHAVHAISSVEIELSLFTTDPLHNGIMDTCHKRRCRRTSGIESFLTNSSFYSSFCIQPSWARLADWQISEA